jgi:hypothetical protein
MLHHLQIWSGLNTRTIQALKHYNLQGKIELQALQDELAARVETKQPSLLRFGEKLPVFNLDEDNSIFYKWKENEMHTLQPMVFTRFKMKKKETNSFDLS